MVKCIQKIWDRISELGVNDSTPPQEKRVIQTLNRVSFLAVLLVAPFFLPAINPTSDSWGWVELASALGFLSVLVANAYDQTQWGASLLILTTNIKIFFSASIRGFEAGEQLFFIPLLAGLVLIYDVRKSTTGRLMWALCLLTFAGLDLTDYQYLNPVQPFSDEVIREIFSINFGITLIIVVAIAFHYSRLADRQQNETIVAMKGAEEASRAKSEFLSVISHELRTPIHAIMNYSDMLKDGPLNPEQEDNLSELRISAENLFTTVDHILHVADLGKEAEVRVNPEPFWMTEPAALAVTKMTLWAENKGLQLTITIPDIPIRVRADHHLIHQVLINLLDNAIKFTSWGRVSVDCRIVVTDENQAILQYRVKDDGKGIPQKQLKTIFQPFVMGDSSTIRSNSGVGLGLTISHRFAKAMNGSIFVKSLSGKGSTFTLEVPAEYIEQGSLFSLNMQTQTDPSQESQPLEVLIVDDHPVNQKVASTMIKKLGHSHTLAVNGEEAVQQCRSKQFQLIFMDIQMPVMDGIEATRQIRALSNLDQQPVIIALTANTTDRDRKACIDAGMNDFMAKPVTKSRIQEKIEQWLEDIPGIKTP